MKWLLSLALLFCLGASAQHRFALGDSSFLLDGHPFQMISGEMHYTRIPREAWRERMRMAKAMGLNTIGTYVFWNVHEPEKGVFDFGGNNDIAAFVETAREEGLWVVLRPSPYVCAEWEFGGYPYWLEQEPGLVVRSREARYLAEYRRYIQELGRRLSPLLVNHGGNILMVQVENEYGSYGDDTAYLGLNRRMFEDAGFDGILYTCDPVRAVARGHLPGLLPAVNGVDKPVLIKQLVNKYNEGKGPYYVAEWYPAWFDWWGTRHHTIPAAAYAGRLDTVLDAGISINMYMFHGGTTRGFMNGANYNDQDPYEPQVSSYDYDAPLDEAGNPTEKFFAFRSVIQKHVGFALPPVPSVARPVSVTVSFSGRVSLFDMLPAPVVSDTPLSFEDLRQAYGYVLYRAIVAGGRTGVMGLPGLRDFGLVFVNGVFAGSLDRRLKQDSLSLTLPAGRVRLDILVENLGRINFGPYLLQNKKGIVAPVTFAGSTVHGWWMYRLPMLDPGAAHFRSGAVDTAPVLRKGTFRLTAPADTYLDMREWGKGCVWVNGHNLGRYWRVGPQQTIYVPRQWVHAGDNEIEVFEMLRPSQAVLKGIDHPILDVLQ